MDANFTALRRVLAYLPALTWAALLLFIGGRSNLPAVRTDLPVDKAAHFVLYGTLGGLATLGWRRARQRPRLIIVLVAAALIGVADELHQRSVPHRSSEAADFVADSLGIAAASWLVLRLTKETANHVV